MRRGGGGDGVCMCEGYIPHAIIARAGTSPEHDGEFGHVGAGHGRDELGAVLGDAALFRVAAYHEAADVLQEDERDVPLRAELYEMGAFEG